MLSEFSHMKKCLKPEIEELNSSNTAIANNYEPTNFTNFVNEWMNIFTDRLTEKMIALGFGELS